MKSAPLLNVDLKDTGLVINAGEAGDPLRYIPEVAERLGMYVQFVLLFIIYQC